MNIYEIDTDEHFVPFEPSRERVRVEVGSMVRCDKQVFRIVQLLDFQNVVGMEVETGRSHSLRISELKPVEQERIDGLYVNHDISTISSDEWAIAQQRFSAIKPLLHNSVLPRASVETRAKEVGVDTATLYRWLERYRSWNEVLALVPRKRGWQSGNSRLTAQAEKLIEQVIDEHYLTIQRKTVQSTISEIESQAKALGITPPSASAIRARVSRIPEKIKLRRRGFADKARNRHTPSVGTFPGADYPLAIVQIDHTPVDLIIVDDRHRKPIGRLWLTLAIDVHSRMITGYYLALEEPSEISVAMCVAHSILPKEAWLNLHGVQGEWPVWGFPRVVHSDNGPDFKAENFRRSCANYNIENQFRPVKRPKYGGHIERLLGTFMRELHELPGTTHSSVTKREGYDSDKHSVLTMNEFEEWLVRSILLYHANYHSAIYMSPARKWHLGFFGNREADALVSIPPRPADPLTVQLDFMPSDRRTIQHYGVQLDLYYYSEALRHWIGTTDPDTGNARKFVFRRDPRDISIIWFYDPVLKQYFRVPVAYQAFPAATLWEYRAAKKQAVEEGRQHIDDALIARLILERRQIVEEASASTKKARRDAQKHKTHSKKSTPARPVNAPAETVPSIPASEGLLLDDVDLIGDIQ
ncbi:Mu transposase C-terminal domain-containing protein [Pseudomonas aeruginosa]|uniref:Mu transposase C-terminal domain-containing protein n=1 Tax=Pseudomonas aeruginosa TaxID=287 RepID=UPI00071BECF2|nr:DDE-type integrase/transposase/recombinase [Pseudomonas aeruginosa]KSC59620.1 transposase [Pseudomonas aeruginosa]MDP5489366.1 DDE-type integrase/transposase/recombinase [Pseudomonas aeruginosa]MDV7940158.1 DDE-type integrase/transposase/recombinase [Pseudomonas aeruginosa]HEC1609946.1 DDE-type integrase/transposase/recombinase [Pseudomonas aeruginosa]HEJ4486899.1 DDE-type integrase/transposase/recombinase [Pseudomonas aeruginosa]